MEEKKREEKGMGEMEREDKWKGGGGNIGLVHEQRLDKTKV